MASVVQRTYICEVCRAGVKMTPSEFQAAGGRARCPHHGKNRPRSTSARIVGQRKQPDKWQPACADCGSKAQPRLHYKTDPRTFAEIRRCLCGQCARDGGWAPYDFTRIAYGTASIGKAAA